MEIITLKEVLKEMRSGSIFSIKWVTADKSRKTGGQIKEYDGCRQSNVITNNKTETYNGDNNNKKPSHYGNATRNIILPNGKIRKLNIWLIIGFNSKKVVLY